MAPCMRKHVSIATLTAVAQLAESCVGAVVARESTNINAVPDTRWSSDLGEVPRKDHVPSACWALTETGVSTM